MRARFLSLATLLLVCAAPAARAQQSTADSAHWARVAAAGRLWSNLKLFHPALASSSRMDWDSVLVQHLAEVEQASDRGSYYMAVTHLLEALNDPLTRLHDTTAVLPAAGKEFWRWEADSTLVITVADVPVTQGALGAALDSLKELLASAHGVVFDGRADVSGRFAALAAAWPESGLDQTLVDTVVRALPERRRYHSGLKPAADQGTGIYYGEGWQVTEGQRLAPRGRPASRPTVFLINRDGWLPPSALAMRQAGRAMILGDGTATDYGSVTSTSVNLADGLTAEIRLGELVGIGARRELVSDTMLPRGFDVALALQVMHSAFHPVFHPMAESPPVGRGPERAYADLAYPDRLHRLIAGFRIWEVMRYFHAYRELYDTDPDRVLEAALPELAGARDSLEYAIAVSHMVVHLSDSHAFVYSPTLGAYEGEAPPPVNVRMIEGKPVIVSFGVDSIARASGIRIGDVIQRVDGEPVMERFQRLLAIFAGSNDEVRARNVCWYLLNGPDGSNVELVVAGADGRSRTVRLPRAGQFWGDVVHLRSGDILRILPGNIGYADLDRLSPGMVDSMFRVFKDTRGIIFDMRGYPLGTAWAIAPHLVRRRVVAASFRRPLVLQPAGTMGDVQGDGGFVTFEQLTPPPLEPYYDRPTVMLINQETQSQAEHTGLFFEAANGTRFVGSTTAGANGDITNFYVPGGIIIGFSGHDVRHADGRQLQRVGLTPDLVVRPTIAGIRAGRDEVLERAARYLTTIRRTASR
jgi:C-terminal processing protease CtpA/Prc